MIVRPLAPDDASACDAIIAGLPDFFGLESGIQACADAVRSEPGYVASDDDGTIIGFLTVERPFPGCAEISWMAVDAARSGVVASAPPSSIGSPPTRLRQALASCS